MKKRVEADLISIAHRILKLKNKAEVDILQIEIKKLYDAITILKFYNDNFDAVKTTVLETDLASKLNDFMDVKSDFLSAKRETDVVHEDLPKMQANSIEFITNDVVETPIAALENEPSIFEPLFEMASIALFEPVNTSPKEISFEELLGKNYGDTDFVKPSELEQEKKQLFSEKILHGLSISLNDRIGFEQHLFAGSSEDFNRVLSQLNTFDSFEEAKDFIDQIVKPDYDYWLDKEEFANRFMDLVENKFK